MHKRFMSIAAATVAMTLSAPLASWAQDGPDLDQVVATVNGTEITLGHIAVAKASLPNEYRNLPAEVLFPGILDQLIRQTALFQTYEGEWPKRVTLSLDNESRSLIAGEVIESIMANAVTPKLVEQMYEERFAGPTESLEYNASHILVETEETAKEVIQTLKDGADFALTAKDKSTGPSGPRGGELGWFGPGVMVPAFEAAVTALEPGSVSEPVQTQFGWHVIKLNEIRQTEAPELDEVRAEIETTIRTEAVNARIEELTSNSIIDRKAGDEIDPSVLDQIDLSNNP